MAQVIGSPATLVALGAVVVSMAGPVAAVVAIRERHARRRRRATRVRLLTRQR